MTFGHLISRGHSARATSRRARAEAGVLGDAWRRFRARAMHTMAPSAWVQTDARGVICRADERAASLFNVSLAHLIGAPLLHFVARRDTRPFRIMVGLLGYPQALYEARVRMRARHGATMPVAIKILPLERGQYRWSLELAAVDPPGAGSSSS